jgi:hypothetical protein
MQKLKDEIISHLLHQPGILSCLLRRHSALGKKVAAWFVGEKPILLIGGEPGSGKSLFMGDLVVQYRMLTKMYPALRAPLALISYDRVHYLFLKGLLELMVPEEQHILPEGETHPEARRLIALILQDILLFAAQHLSSGTRVVLEAPLIDLRGESLIEMLSALKFSVQIFIIHSPVMWTEVLRQQPERGTSAQALAMKQIHETLLRQRTIPHGERTEDVALKNSWEQWLSDYEGIVLTWNPKEDETSYQHTKETLQAQKIVPDPLAPEALQEYTSFLIHLVLKLHQDLDSFALAVQNYNYSPA